MLPVMQNVFVVVLYIAISTSFGQNATAQLTPTDVAPTEVAPTGKNNRDKTELNPPSLQDQNQQLQQQINDQENALAALLTKHGAEWDQLEATQKGLEDASTVFANDNSDSNKSKLRNAQFKSVLAKRKFNKITTLKNELSEQIALLRDELSVTERKLSALNPVSTQAAAARIEKTPSLVSKKTTQNAASSIGINSLETKTEAETARGSKQTIETPPRVLPKPELQKTPTNAEKIPASISTETQTTLKPSYSNLAINGQGEAKPYSSKSTIKQLYSIEQVRSEELRLRKKLSTKSRDYANYNKMIIVKSRGDQDTKSASNSYTLRTLGHDQYQAEIDLVAGRNQLVIGFKRWNISVSEQQQNHRYIIIMDNSNKNSPRVTYFPQSLSAGY